MTSKTEAQEAEEADLQPVDLAIHRQIYSDAMARLKAVRAQERQETGASRTTLAEIGRTAILNWKPDGRRSYAPTPRSPNGKAPKRTPFRFKMAAEPYAEAQTKIHGASLSITQVVEEALVRFAQTGR